MPAVAVIAGAVGVGEGIAAMGTAVGALETISAGAMIVGGAATAIGGLTGNSDLQKTGAMIGLAGGLGSYATDNLPSLSETASHFGLGAGNSSASAGINAETNPFSTGAVESGDTAGMLGKNSLTNQSINQAAGGAPAASFNADRFAPAGYDASQFTKTAVTKEDLTNAVTSSQQQLQKYSLISGMLQGAGSAYGARTQADIAAQTQANYLEYQRSLSNRANANANAMPTSIPVSGTGMLNTGVKTIPGVTTGAKPLGYV